MSLSQRQIQDIVIKRYPLCKTRADKELLAKEVGIDSLSKLYNLANRLSREIKASQKEQELQRQKELVKATKEKREKLAQDKAKQLRKINAKKPLENDRHTGDYFSLTS